MEWLHENHPESRTEGFVNSNNGRENSPLFIADAFSDLPVASPLSIVTSELLMETGHDAEVSSNIVEHDDDKSINKSSTAGKPELKDTKSTSTRNNNSLEGVIPVVENDKTLEEEIDSQRLSKDKDDDVVSFSSKTKAIVAEDNEEDDNLRYISKYLVQFVPDAKPKNKETAVRISGARVLTSDKCAAILKEREEKIKKQQEEKERRKMEREQQRKEKEEQQKKKKALAAAKKAEKEAKKAKNQEGSKVNRKRQCCSDVNETKKSYGNQLKMM